MKHPLLALFLLGAVLCRAQNQDLNTHVFWDAKGTYENEGYGYNGLSNLGRLNDTIPHAVAVGLSNFTSVLIYNRFPRDTAVQYVFPGKWVVRGSINGDSFPDFVCIGRQKITVLFGTAAPNRFDTALVLNGRAPDDLNTNDKYVCVTDLDSDGYDDIVLSIPNYSADGGRTLIGRLLFYKGGSVLDSTPTDELRGGLDSNTLGGMLQVGRVRGDGHRYLCELHLFRAGTKGFDAAKVFLYPLDSHFRLVQRDTILCLPDTSRFGYIVDDGGFRVIQVDQDSIDDIVFACLDYNYHPDLLVNNTVVVYKGGSDVTSQPNYFFHRPVQTHSSAFGYQIVDIGDVTGRGYHSLLVTDPGADLGGYFSGAIFLYSMGSALKDSCVGLAVGHEYEGYFGTSAIPLGDVTGDGRADFMVGGDAEFILGAAHVGYVAVYSGDTSYGPLVRVEDPTDMPLSSELGQNYPNPFSAQTTIEFSIVETQHVRVVLFDALGRQLSCLVDQVLAPGKYQRSVSSAGLRAGIYEYRLSLGERRIAKIMTVVE